MIKIPDKHILWLIPAIGILVSILVSVTTLRYELEKERDQFTNRSNLLFENIWNVFDELNSISNSVSLFFNTLEVVSEDQFNLFTKPTIKRYPFIENIYYIPRVEKVNLKNLEQEKRNSGYTGFHFRKYPHEQFKPSPIEKYIFPISYVQPYTVVTSMIIGRDILTYKSVQEAIIISTESGNTTILSPAENKLYAFNSLYFGQEGPKRNDMNIDNVYAILGFKISPTELLKFISLPDTYDLEITINNMNFISRDNIQAESNLNLVYSHKKAHDFNGQLIIARSTQIKSFLDFNLALPIFVLFTGLLLTFLIWFVFRKNIEFSNILHQQNKIIEAEVDEKTEQLKSFSYSVSHDLRAPLRAIDGFCKILDEDYADKLDTNGVEYLRRVRNGAQHMGMLIDSMLNLALLGHKNINNGLVSLSDIANDIIKNLQVQQPDRNVIIDIADNIVVHGDSTLLHSLMDNLLSNAWKFTAKNVDAKIEFKKTTVDNETVYYVKDNGIGFDMKYANKLFIPFQRLHGEKYEGTGVGLAIVERIIKRHRGTITVTSKLNEGSRFTFSIGTQLKNKK